MIAAGVVASYVGMSVLYSGLSRPADNARGCYAAIHGMSAETLRWVHLSRMNDSKGTRRHRVRRLKRASAYAHDWDTQGCDNIIGAE